MANLQETAQWETGIYQLETSDPVMGGADGVDNRQAKQLGNRTLWLKNKLEQMAREIPAAVTKSDAVNSDSSANVATSKAVKTAYDKAVAAENAASGAVKTSGNQDIGGSKTFTGLATMKKGAIVADSDGDFNANQYLQIGSNNVNSYFYNKKSGKYLSMRNDGELRYDGKRLLNTDDLSNMTPTGDKAANGWCRLPNGLILQWGFKPVNGNWDVNQSVAFPVAFPSVCLNVSLTPSIDRIDTDHNAEFGVHSLSATGFKFFTWLNPYLGHYWTAIGY